MLQIDVDMYRLVAFGDTRVWEVDATQQPSLA